MMHGQKKHQVRLSLLGLADENRSLVRVSMGGFCLWKSGLFVLSPSPVWFEVPTYSMGTSGERWTDFCLRPV